MAGIDLGLLPPLSVIKQMTHEEIQGEMRLLGQLDSISPADPAGRVILSGSYREMLLRQEADEQCRAVMLATAKGGDLDNIAVTYYRHVNGDPVKRLDGEEDEAFRYRLHNSPAGLSTAGPDLSYEFHAMSAHPNIKQALCTSPAPVRIKLYVLGHQGNGVVTKAQCDVVDAYLWPRRPMTDQVEVVSAEIIEYRVKATIYQVKNSDPDGVTANSIANLERYTKQQHRLRGRVTLSALHAVMMVSGVEEVALEGWSDVNCGQHQAPFCVSVDVVFGGWSDTQAVIRPGVPNEWA